MPCCLTPGHWSRSTFLRDSLNDSLISWTKRLGLYEDIPTILAQRQCHLLKDLKHIPIDFMLLNPILGCLRSVFREVKPIKFFYIFASHPRRSLYYYLASHYIPFAVRLVTSTRPEIPCYVIHYSKLPKYSRSPLIRIGLALRVNLSRILQN
jgi:hypothetical protein